MTDPIHAFYCSKKYTDLSLMLKIKSGGICARCNGVFDIPTMRTHHKIYLTYENINDPNITLNEKHIEVICHDCHNKEHKRFGITSEVRRVYLVHGAPCAGKATYVSQVATRYDLIVNLDYLQKAICNCGIYDKPDATKAEAFALRDKLLERVRLRAGKWQDAYIVGGYPDRTEREQIVRDYGAEVIYIDTPRDECIARAYKDKQRGASADVVVSWIESYFTRLKPDTPPRSS